MPSSTHYYGIVGDGHTRGNKGPGSTLLDPLGGLLLTTFGETQPAVLNTIIRGAAAKARVTRVVAANTYHVELFGGVLAFASGEALTYDSGGTASCGILVSATLTQAAAGATAENPITGQRDALLNSFIPDDGSDDTVFWDRRAKVCRHVTLAAGWTQTFLPGERISVRSGGSEVGQFTVWNYADAGGGAVYLWIIRPSGTIAAGSTLRNLTTAQGADHGTLSAVDADTPTGIWKRLHMLPNDGGLGVGASGGAAASLYDQIPFGDGSDGSPGFGPMHTLLRKAQEFWRNDTTAANRGVRGFLYEVQDYQAPSMLRGGVTVQVVEVTGGSGTFQVGETVSSGTWSAKVHTKTASKLYVHTTNGAVLVASTTITGATSGATCTASTTCIGWHPGSAHWQNMVTELTAARGATGALFSGSAEKFEGLLLMIWESEIGPFVPGEAAWPTEAQMVQQWTLFIAALRTLYANPELPITLWQMDARSHPEIGLGGFNFANITRALFSLLARTIPGVAITPTTGMEGASATALPYPSNVLWLRPFDYLEIGTRAWRSLQFAATPVPAGEWRPILLFLLSGQSNMTGSQSSSIMNLDADPDLWKSAAFPGVSTIDVNVWQWNSDPNVQAWENYDIALNGNPFFGQFGFSPVQAVLALRMKGRFADNGVPVDIGFIHIPVNGSTANAASPNAVTWDPLAPARFVVTQSQTVTVFGLTGSTLNPKRGRFTGTGGLYDGFVAGNTVQVSGSALGFVGSGGNNHSTYSFAAVHAVDPSGNWIEILGEHVAETATFTITKGAFPIMPLATEQIRKAIGACATQLQRVPQPIGLAWDQGESDIFTPTGYQEALKRVLDELLDEFALARKGAAPIAIVIVRQTANTPWGTDEQVAAIQQAQEAVVAAYNTGAATRAAIVDSDNLQMASNGIWPRTQRQHNNVHRTLQALIAEGYLIDRAFGTLGLPAHPNGDPAILIGATDGGAVDNGTDAPPAEEGAADAGADTSESEATSIIDRVEEAFAGGSIDVQSYTVNGRTTTRYPLKDLIELHKYGRALRQQAQGITRTVARFH